MQLHDKKPLNAYDDQNCFSDPFLWTLCILFSFFLPLLQKEKTMHHYDAAIDVKTVVMQEHTYSVCILLINIISVFPFGKKQIN